MKQINQKTKMEYVRSFKRSNKQAANTPTPKIHYQYSPTNENGTEEYKAKLLARFLRFDEKRFLYS